MGQADQDQESGASSDLLSGSSPGTAIDGASRERTLPDAGLGTFAAGEVVGGRYRIVRFLAHGGMGEVYEALDTELQEHVALKTVLPHLVDRQPTAMERFKREIQLARKVSHPNVCRVFDIGRHAVRGGEIVFLTMEMLEGESLQRRIERTGKLAPAEALPIISQMTAALDAAHEAGIVHRDFKPANIMLVKRRGGRDRVVVTDFGIARALAPDDSQVSLTGTGLVIGSAAYMAPEQVQDGEITAAADIYALGVVMYEMMTGRHPFVGTTPLAVATKRLMEQPTAPREVVQDLPPAWDEVILRCLAKGPAERFPSAGAVAAALAAPQTIVTTVRGRGMWWIAAIAGAVALGGTAAYLAITARERAPAPTQVSDKKPIEEAKIVASPAATPQQPARPAKQATEKAGAARREGERLFREGNMSGARTKYLEALAGAGENHDARGRLLAAIATTHFYDGDLATAEARGKEAIESGGTDASVPAHLAMGHVALARGDVDGAERSYSRAVAAAEGSAQDLAEAQLALAMALAEKPDLTRAETLIRDAVRAFREQGAADLEALGRAFAARSAVSSSSEDDARRAIGPVDELLAKGGAVHRTLLARVHAAVARAALSGSPAEAHKGLEEVLRETIRLGLLPLQLETRLALGEVEVRTGPPIIGIGRLKVLEKEASARGFRLIAGKAASLASGPPTRLRQLLPRPRSGQ